MSANLDLVRSIFAAWERADYSTTDWAHGEIEFVIAEGPSPGRWTGLAEMAEGYRDWLTAWEAYRVKADEYRELDSERVLVLVRSTGRGKTSGLELGRIQSHLLCVGAAGLDLGAFTAFLYGFNERAIAHAERSGFLREGVKRRAYLRHGDWVDGVVFGLTREDLEQT